MRFTHDLDHELFSCVTIDSSSVGVQPTDVIYTQSDSVSSFIVSDTSVEWLPTQVKALPVTVSTTVDTVHGACLPTVSVASPHLVDDMVLTPSYSHQVWPLSVTNCLQLDMWLDVSVVPMDGAWTVTTDRLQWMATSNVEGSRYDLHVTYGVKGYDDYDGELTVTNLPVGVMCPGMLELDRHCLQSCPDGYHQEDTMCVPCDDDCLQCVDGDYLLCA